MMRVNGIGIWFKILTTISHLSILTNVIYNNIIFDTKNDLNNCSEFVKAFIIAFSSDFIDKTFYFIENSSIVGFTNYNLLQSQFLPKNETCRYFASKHHENIDLTSNRYFQILALKLLFIIIYQV